MSEARVVPRLAAIAGMTALLLSPAEAAEGLRRGYFGNCGPGAWAKHTMTSAGDESELTYTRLPDDRGRVVIQHDYRAIKGLSAGWTARSTYVLRKDYPIGEKGLDYGGFVEALSMQAGEGPASVSDADMVKAVSEGMSRFESFTFVAEERVAGHACDRYRYVAVSGGPAPTKDTGDIWLDDAVPFGFVKQVGTVKDGKTGEVRSHYEMVLKDAGGGGAKAPVVALPTEAKAPAKPGRAQGRAWIGGRGPSSDGAGAPGGPGPRD